MTFAVSSERHCGSSGLRYESFCFGLATVVLFTGDFAACEQVVAEVGGCVTVVLGDIRTFKHFAESGENDFRVTPEGDFLDIFKVVGNLGLPGHCIAAVHLRKSAKSLPHSVAFALFRGHKYHVANKLRSRPDDGHVALEDVEELGEFIEAGGAEELAVGVQAHVVGEQVSLGVTLVCHGAELDKLEYFLVLAGAKLREEGIALHLDCAEDCKHDEERVKAEDGGQGTAKIQDSF